MASNLRVGRILWDADGNEWRVVRLYVARGEAMVRDERRGVERRIHPVHDAGRFEVIG